MHFHRLGARTLVSTAFLPPLAIAATLTASSAAAAETASASCGSPVPHPRTGACAPRSPSGATVRAAARKIRMAERKECWCWHFVRPEGLADDSALTGISAPSRTTGWTVGHAGSTPLALRWTGARWQRTALPLPDRTRLNAISATSARDAWIVGTDAGGQARTFHWDGRHWLSGALPASGGKPISAAHVTGFTPTDTWAVGSTNGFAGTMAAAWHHDGRGWTITPTRSAPGSTLNAVAAGASGDAWAVGTAGTRQLLLHWDGHTWTPADPPQAAALATPTGVAAVAPGNVWAVGTTPSGAPMVERWDGRAWTVVPAPLPSNAGAASGPRIANGATAVVPDGDKGVWISGSDAVSRPYMAHYDGTTWDVSRLPLPDASRGVVASISALTHVPGTREVRAAGSFRAPNDSSAHALTWTNAPRPR